MAYIRLLNFSLHYSKELGRFKSPAFENTGKPPGISVIDLDCANHSSGNACQHCARYYAAVAGLPIIFWTIPDQIVEDGCHLEQETTESGDVCHYNIRGLSDNRARKIIIRVPIEELMICADEGPRSMTGDDLNALLQ